MIIINKELTERTTRAQKRVEELEEEFNYRNHHDILTDLYNRKFLKEEMKRLNSEEQFPLGLIMIDINNLNQVNNTYGLKEGDRLLIKTSHIIKTAYNEQGIIGRWGGDEFVILLPLTGPDKLDKIINRIKKLCRKTADDKLPVSLALGGSSNLSKREDIYTLFNKVESLMYINKLSNQESARGDVVKAFLYTLREKSNETEEHAKRMQKMALALGRRLNLSSAELDKLSLIALLHDIGKITVPERILNKQGKLTDKEWTLIKEHPIAGYRIVSSIKRLSDIAEGILYHHERWDGLGYPEGLKGEKINILARIISIVDSFDVMVTGRIYKKQMTRREACQELKRCAGTQFDPQLVDIFIDLISQKRAQIESLSCIKNMFQC